MVQGQVVLKLGGWHFSYMLYFFNFIIFKFKNLSFAKLHYTLCYHNFMKKVT